MSNKRLENSFDIEGNVVYVGKPEPWGNKSTNYKRILSLKLYEGRYEVSVPFEFYNKNMDQLNGISVGDHVIINFTISGNFQDKNGEVKWFSRIKGRTVQKL